MTKNSQTIKQKIAKLDKILEWFESGDFEVEKATEKYQQAHKLATEIKQDLENVKLKVEQIK